MNSARKSVKLFLAEGHANGLIVATIPNWTGSLIRGRNADLPSLLGRPEAQGPGVYILAGSDPEDEQQLRAYIGQASPLRKRIADHAKEKDWWDVAVIVSTQDPNFSAGHFLSLEAELIRLSADAGRANLENVQRPGSHAGGLGEADQADVENFLAEIRLVLPLLGLDILRANAANASTKVSSSTALDDQDHFFLKNRGRALAEAVEASGEFVVLKGSKALLDPGHKTNQYRAHREKLIRSGSLALESEEYIFQRNVAFSSPSKAAAVVLDRNDNGRTSWKTKSGLTYHDWQQRQVESEEFHDPIC